MRDMSKNNPNIASEARLMANAVEALSNIFYHIEQDVEKPENVRAYLGVAQPVMAVLKEHAIKDWAAQYGPDNATDANTEPENK